MNETTPCSSAPMYTYGPVNQNLPARIVAYVSEDDYSREFTPDVPLVAVVLCTVPGTSQTVRDVLSSLPPFAELRYYGLSHAVIAYNGVLPPTFFAETLAYIIREWIEEQEALEELVCEALDMMSLIDAGGPVSHQWIAARDRLIVKARQVLHLNVGGTVEGLSSDSRD